MFIVVQEVPVEQKTTRRKKLETYADEKQMKALYSYLYHRLFLIYDHLLQEGSVEATAEDLKGLMKEIEP